MWNEMIAFAMSSPTAFAFIELHNHASYLDAESIAIDRNVKDFARGDDPARAGRGAASSRSMRTSSWSSMFGAFVGMMRAHWEGRIELSDDVTRRCRASVLGHGRGASHLASTCTPR